MEVLEKHAVKVGFVPLDVLDGAGGEGAVKLSTEAAEAAAESGELAEILLGGPEGVALEADESLRRQRVRATRWARTSSRSPMGSKAAIWPARWSSQSACCSISGSTGLVERMPWRRALKAGACLIFGGRPRGRRMGRRAGLVIRGVWRL